MSETKVKSQLERAQEEALAALRQLGGEMLREEAIEFKGSKIMLPEGTTIDQNIEFLKFVQKEGAEQAEWRRVYPYKVRDGQAATWRALDRAFGKVKHAGQASFFGASPPRLDTITVGFGETMQVPNIGDPLSVPALPDVTLIPYGYEDEQLGEVFCLYASGLKSRSAEVNGLFNLVETELRERSIYKGQAIDGKFNFLDLSQVRPEQVVYSEATMRALEVSVFGPIEHQDRLEKDGISLKGAVLLFGPFGTGKTLAAYLTAQRAVAQGWTFIFVSHDDDLFEALKSANLYGPAVVFFEDVDTLMGDPELRERLLEAFDGIKQKGQQIRVVLTTNYKERIDAGMIRPGRIDAMIEIGLPDAEAIHQLVELNTPHLSPDLDDESWDKVTSAMEGFLPAFVIEAVRRAHMAAVIRADREGGEVQVDSDDLRLAAVSLRPQLELMHGAPQGSEKDTLRGAIQDAVRPTVETVLAESLDPRLLRKNGGG